MSLDMMRFLINRGYLNYKLQGRNKSVIAFLDMLGSYVYEPIGWYQGVKDSITSAAAIEKLDMQGLNKF